MKEKVRLMKRKPMKEGLNGRPIYIYIYMHTYNICMHIYTEDLYTYAYI